MHSILSAPVALLRASAVLFLPQVHFIDTSIPQSVIGDHLRIRMQDSKVPLWQTCSNTGYLPVDEMLGVLAEPFVGLSARQSLDQWFLIHVIVASVDMDGVA
jgi:hypothetical protein